MYWKQRRATIQLWMPSHARGWWGEVVITVPDAHCFHIIVDSSESLRESHRDRKQIQIQIKITVENQTHFQLGNCPRSEKRKLHFICANAQNHNEQGSRHKRSKRRKRRGGEEREREHGTQKRQGATFLQKTYNVLQSMELRLWLRGLALWPPTLRPTPTSPW